MSCWRGSEKLYGEMLPVIILSGRDSEDDKVQAFDLGADGYRQIGRERHGFEPLPAGFCVQDLVAMPRQSEPQ